MIIDFHAHAFPEKIVSGAVGHLENHYGIKIHQSGLYEELLKNMKKAGIDKAVFFNVATKPSQVEQANKWILAHASEDLLPFGTLHPEDPAWPERLEEIAPRVYGIKLHPDFQAFYPDDKAYWPFYEAIFALDLPILFHAGDETLPYATPQRLAKVVEGFPNSRIILAHLGGYARWQEAEEYIYGKDVWLDTSSVFWRLGSEDAWKLIRKHDRERILFGTDYPVSSYSQEIAWILEHAREDEAELILYRNAARLLKLEKKILP
ncbi:MAG: amidohydrolase family protein [Firmicutes bacterium]|nr:amidohydrolase family protein [Bacillota bacterium]HOB21555.1 amidohydrolase family protein [Bacillota bacterium]